MASPRTSPRKSDFHKADKLATRSMTGYPGSKGASGVAAKIIRGMPPHKIYIEPFAGKAAVFRVKLPAASSILMDVDAKCCHRLRSYLAGRDDAARVEVINGDAMDLLPALPAVRAFNTLVYCDPPYVGETRSKRWRKYLYDFDLTESEAHEALLKMLMQLPCLVMISGYPSILYDSVLRNWNSFEFTAMTRGGPRIERVWHNFPEPAILHDSRFVGGDYRERELVKKQRARWSAKFLGMDPRRRQAIAAALVDVDRAAVEAAMQILPPSPMVATSAGQAK